MKSNITKSAFDSGNWSATNGLPGQDDIINFLEHLLSNNPNLCFTRRELMEWVIVEFGIEPAAAEATGPHSNCNGFYTRMTYLITDAIRGVRRADHNQFAKRVAFGVYQHISGNGAAYAPKPKILSVRKVGQAAVSVRILKELNESPEEIACQLTHLWDDDVINAAVKQVFEL